MPDKLLGVVEHIEHVDLLGYFDSKYDGGNFIIRVDLLSLDDVRRPIVEVHIELTELLPGAFLHGGTYRPYAAEHALVDENVFDLFGHLGVLLGVDLGVGLHQLKVGVDEGHLGVMNDELSVFPAPGQSAIQQILTPIQEEFTLFL